MAKYKLVHQDDVESRGESGTFKMFKGSLEAEQVTISYRTFPAKSGAGRGHDHSKIEEIIYIIKGNLKVKVDDEVVELKSGDALRISPNTWRGYKNDSDEETITIIASPVLGSQESDASHDENFWAKT